MDSLVRLQPQNMAENSTRPSSSISTAAVVLLLGSLGMCYASAWYLKKAYAGSMSQFLLYAHSFAIAIVDLLAILLLVFSLLGIVTSIGLFSLREPARKAAIFLSTFPLGLVVFVLFLLLTENSQHGAESMNAASGLIVCGAVLVVLPPPSIWWLILFTRNNVRSQFH